MSKIIKTAERAANGIVAYEHDLLDVSVALSDEEMPTVDPAVVMAEARVEAEEKVQEAYAEGMRRGEQAGRERFDESLAECEAALQAAGRAILEAQTEFIESLEPQVISVIDAIALRILRKESTTDRELVKTMAREALTCLTGQEQLLVRVNPQDAQALRDHRVDLLSEIEGINHFEIIDDDSVSPGGCVTESDRAHIDSRFESQLKEILDRLME
jgi:flagellar assembly protein FliH